MQIAILLISSCFAATFGTIVGAGGGFVLSPILMFMYPDASPTWITFITLFTALCNGGSATVAYTRMRRIDFRTGVLFGLGTIFPAMFGVYVIHHMHRNVFTPIFGVFLIVVAGILIRKVTARKTEGSARVEPKPGWTRRTLTDIDGARYDYAFNLRLGVALSGLVGFCSSFFGIGGGIIQVPIMTQLLRIPVLVATATSIFVLLISASVGVTTHLVSGHEQINLTLALTAGVGAIFGGQIGSRVARRLRGKTVLIFLAIALAIVGVRLALRAF